MSKRKVVLVVSVLAFIVSATVGRAKLHAESKGPKTFAPTREELATIRGFGQEQEELEKAITSFVKRAAKDRDLPEDARFGWNSQARCWVLAGDVAVVTT